MCFGLVNIALPTPADYLAASQFPERTPEGSLQISAKELPTNPDFFVEDPA